MRNLLKFITCGSVDDGKSTLIGHILYDTKKLYTDQEQALELESKVGSRGGEIDYSLLLDGLMAEREQGMRNIPATWRLAHPLQTLPSFWWMHLRVCWYRPAAMPASVP